MAEWIWGTGAWGETTEWTTVVQTGFTVGAASTLTAGVVVDVELSMAIAAATDMLVQSSDNVLVAPDNSDVYVTPTTARLYERLPSQYRDADAAVEPSVVVAPSAAGTWDSGSTWDAGSTFDDPAAAASVVVPASSDRPLLRWLASLVDQAGQVEAFIDQCTPVTTSALTDPALADTTWLPWLAQLVGLSVSSPVADEATVRANIAGALTGTRRGSKPSIAAAVATVLSGSQTVTVTDHFGGNPWIIGVDTLSTETPDDIDNEMAFTWDESAWGEGAEWTEVDPIVLLLDDANVKPAGYQIIHTES